MASNLAETRPLTAARRRYERPRLRPLDRARWRSLMMITAFVDMFALGTALYVATATRFGRAAIKSQGAYGQYLWMWLILWMICLAAVGLYERHRTDNRIEEMRHVVHGVTLGAAVAIAGSFFVKFELSRIWAILSWALGLFAVIAGRTVIRFGVRMLRRRGRLRRRAIIVGSGDEARSLASAVEKATWEGVDVIGFVASNIADAVRDGESATIENLRDMVLATEATEVLVAAGAVGEGHFAKIVSALDGLPVELRVAPGVEGYLPSRVAVHPLGDRPLLAVERAELRPAARIFKRTLDLALGLPLLILAAPVITLCAIAVRFDSKGSAFFKQRRVGVDGKAFNVIKLRSMVADAETRRMDIEHANEADGGLLFKMRDDPRVTRVGAFLRRTSLDELPQFFNVLKGDMSLVGPRPPLPSEVEQYDDPLRRRLLVKPGITGLWQVSGRHELSFEDYIRYDLLYVQSWSIALDIFILLKTIPAVLLRRGAY
jgi:exopolysaccharide biosynthesis polyprenyl glycosylphosphotransferase